jgi:hypothetical protein
MRIYKPRGDDFVGTVNNLCVCRGGDFRFDLRNYVAFNQEVCSHSLHMIVAAVNEESSSLEKCEVYRHLEIVGVRTECSPEGLSIISKVYLYEECLGRELGSLYENNEIEKAYKKYLN